MRGAVSQLCTCILVTCISAWYGVSVINISSLSLVGSSGHLTRVSHSSHKSSATHSYPPPIPIRHPFLSAICYPFLSATHSYQCVQYFHVSKQLYDCQSVGFLTCAQMLMHGIACRGCTNTVREAALKVDGQKSLALPRT